MYAGTQLDDEINNEFSLLSWVCPNVTNITVNNDVFNLFGCNSTSFGMVVNTCSDAKKIDIENNVMSYTDVGCDLDAEADIEAISVYTKLLTVSSDPQHFEEYGHMQPIFQYRHNTQLLSDFIQHANMLVEEWKVTFSSSQKWY